jgi:hypothetical protein
MRILAFVRHVHRRIKASRRVLAVEDVRVVAAERYGGALFVADGVGRPRRDEAEPGVHSRLANAVLILPLDGHGLRNDDALTADVCGGDGLHEIIEHRTVEREERGLARVRRRGLGRRHVVESARLGVHVRPRTATV